MTDGSGNVAAAVAAGARCVEATKRIHVHGGVPLALLREADGAERLEVQTDAMELAAEAHRVPKRRMGESCHDELGSFVAHVLRYKSESTVIFADRDESKLVAVYDYHPAGGNVADAAWCEHRATYACPLDPRWLFWTSMHNRLMSQEEFGDMLEAHLEDLTSGEGYPDPIGLLEMARDIRIHTKGRFERKLNPTTGESTLVCKQETESTSTQIPRACLLALPVFVGGTMYSVEARIRVQLREGVPKFGYLLHRHEEIQRDAFGDVRTEVAAQTEVPVFAGTPE